jgi:hypothetical protein
MSEFATSTTEVSPSTIPDPKVLQEQASKIVMERRKRFNDAYDEAISEITKDASTKIKADVDVGHYRSILYSFHFSDVKDAEVDKMGTKIRFGDGVFLRDMITRGHYQFFGKLTDHFNSSVDSKGYHTGFFRNKNDGSYNIYVSWAPKPQHHTGPRKGPFKPAFPKDGEAASPDADGFVPHRPPFKHHQGPPGPHGGHGGGRGRGSHSPGRGGGRGPHAGRGGRGAGASSGPKGPYAAAVMKPKVAQTDA